MCADAFADTVTDAHPVDGRRRMSDHPEAPGRRLRRYPRAALVPAAAAVMFSGVLPSPYIYGYLRAGAVYLLVPPVLLLVAAILAATDRSASDAARTGWGVTCGVAAAVIVPLMWVVAVLLFGP